MRKVLTILAVIVLVAAIGFGVVQWLNDDQGDRAPPTPGNDGGVLAEQPEWYPAVEVIAAPGTTESRADDNPMAPTASPHSLLLGLTSSISESYSEGDVKVWTTPYPTQIKAHQLPDQLTYDDSQTIGRDVIAREMADLHGQCPLTDFVLMGFSQGAAIAGNLASDIGNGHGVVPAERTADVALLGDPRRDPNQGVNQGVPLADAGIGLSLQPLGGAMQAVVPGATIRDPRDGLGPLNDKVQSVCAPSGSFCDVPPGVADVIARAQEMIADAGAHAAYATNDVAIPGTTPLAWTEGWICELIEQSLAR